MLVPLPSIPAGNFWSDAKAFASRGGFANGLIPNVVGNVWYVNTNSITDQESKRGPVGSDGNTGLSPFTPFATMARAFTFVRSYDIIVVDGVIREQLVSPATVYNVTIVGGSNQTPRQATSGGVATGGGASWLPPTSPVALTPLLEILSAGWTLMNIQMSPTTSAACVRLTRSAVVDATDGSHAAFLNCFFVGGTTPIGIEDNGGCGFVQIAGCRFQNLTSGIKGLNTAAAIPLSWSIIGNRFQQNTNDITMSLSFAIIQGNNFMTAGSGAVNKVISTIFVAGQGGNNQVLLNFFSNAAANIQISNGYSGAATDMWSNYPLGTAALSVTSPPGA